MTNLKLSFYVSSLIYSKYIKNTTFGLSNAEYSPDFENFLSAVETVFEGPAETVTIKFYKHSIRGD